MPAVTQQPVRLSLAPATPVQPRMLQPHPVSVRGLPTSTHGVVQGRPGAWAGLLGGIVLRAGLIGAGFYAGGVRDPKTLALGSLASSATLSGLLVAGHAFASSQRSR
jgi:hypothetical protein